MDDRKKQLLAIFAGAFFLCALRFPLTGFASEVAVLLSDDKSAFQEALQGFETMSRELGITDFQVYHMRGKADRGLAVVQQIKLQQPKVVLAIGARAASLARAELKFITIIYCMVVNPEKYGLTGENVVGVRWEIPPGEQFAFLKDLIPGMRSIGVLYNPNENRLLVLSAREAAAAQGLSLVDLQVFSPREIAREMKSLIGNIDAFWFIRDPTIISEESFQYVLKTTIDHRIPIFTFSSLMVERGALLSFSPNYLSVGITAGKLVREILRGKPLSEIDPPYPEGEIAVNLATANTLGIRVPAEVQEKIKSVH